MEKSKQLPEPTEYEKRTKAIALAIQHSRNCQAETLIKIAEKIYEFMNKKKS